jgi:asparagine synthase (glutamine-hydrolysing)
LILGRDELMIKMLSLINYFSDDLIADGSQIPSYIITNHAAKYSKVILSGMGADEYLLGYAGHQISLLSKYLDKTPDMLSQSITSLFIQFGTWEKEI